ncbi:hypothetical protein PIB30_098947 [Stylosanthes scabra]|uniref:Putative plant transposon protein domain-containing protein n=1 Tax=Stylosanthes scabra TaxID=79078 RepID=A0ABU6QW23_9FABA|nr:hypothetical protein [Stylosanthes scabra]
MALSSVPASVFDDYRFREEFNQTLFESSVRRKKIIPEVGFNLDEGEYPQIKEKIALRGWRRLAAPTTGISKPLVQEFYANAAVSDEEMENAGQLPYKSYVRGVEVNFFGKYPKSNEVQGRNTRCRNRLQNSQATDQWLDEVLAELFIPGATWKLSSSQPAVPIQLRRTELLPLGRGWQEFIIHSLVPTGNKSEITVARAILIHVIMRGEDVRAEDIIADNMVVIAQRLHGKGNLSFPSTIYKLCKDAGVPLREDEDDEDEPVPQAGGGNEEDQEQQQYHQFQQPPQQHYQEFQQNFENQYHQDLQGIEEHLSSMQFLQHSFYENMQKSQAEYMEEEIQEIRKGQINKTLSNTQKAEAEKNLEQAVEKQARDISEMRKQLNLWTRNASAREAYSCWAHQQANPNLSEIPVNHIPDLMQTNAESGRPMFYGALKSNVGASSSSQSAQQEPVPLRTAPPLPGYQPTRPPPN